MKKLFLFLGAAAIIGVGSAFTSVMMDPPTSGTYLQVSTGVWQAQSMHPDADCIESSDICSYDKTGNDPGSFGDPLKNPANFEPRDQGTLDLGD